MKIVLFFSFVMTFQLYSLNIYGKCFQQDESKGIQAEEYVKKRPAAKKLTGNKSYSPARNESQARPVKKRYYRAVKQKPNVKPEKPMDKTTENALLGFTLWRFQPASDEDQSKGLTEVSPQTGKLQKSARLEVGTPLAVGDQIRIGIESLSHDGYLYIVEREKYADGSYGAANLVFPTLRSRGGNNFVRAGVLTSIPASTNFEITRDTERRQTAEELIIIVSPKILIDPSLLQLNQIKIPTDQLTGWLKQWKVEEFRRELIDSVGQSMTAVEQFAGQEQAKGLKEVTTTLTQDDEPPQTVFQMNIKRGMPLIATVTLQIKP